jgi:hypothetical protein
VSDRRRFLLATAGAAGAQILSPGVARAESSDAVSSERARLVFTMKVLVGPALQVGSVRDGVLSVIPLIGGSVDGPRVKGAVLPGGSSWLRRRPDGSIEYLVRNLIRADNGQIIADQTRGYVSAPTKDAPSTPSRTTHVFEVTDGPYRWLNDAVCFGVVDPVEGGRQVRVYELGA